MSSSVGDNAPIEWKKVALIGGGITVAGVAGYVAYKYLSAPSQEVSIT